MTSFARINRFFPSLFLFLFLSVWLCALEKEKMATPEVSLLVTENCYEKGKPLPLIVQMKLPPGWHIYGKDPGSLGVPPSFTWKLPKGFHLTSLQWPSSKILDLNGVRITGYEGTISWIATFEADSEVLEGHYPLVLHLTWLSCGELCIPGEQQLSVSVTIGNHSLQEPRQKELLQSALLMLPEKSEVVTPPFFSEMTPIKEKGGMEAFASRGIWHFLFLGFIGGLILNITPCVLPVIGLKLVSLISSKNVPYKQSLISSLAYTFGIVITFWILALLLFFLQRAGTAFGWGFQLQNPYFVIFLIMLFLVISANLFGLYEWGHKVAAWAQDQEEQAKVRFGEHFYLKAFMSGLLATCVATPCTGPLLGAVIGFASLLSLWKALILFTSIALGMASPFVLIALMPPLAWILPRPGPWMITFKQLMGFSLLLSTVWLMWVLSYISPSLEYELLLLGALVLFFSVWLYGKSQMHPNSFVGKLAFLLFLLSCCAGVSLTFSSFDVGFRKALSYIVFGKELVWQPYTAERLKEEIDAGHIVLVKGTARWCLTCQANQLVFSNESLKRYLLEKKVVLLVADWTNQQKETTDWLHSLRSNGVPTTALYKSGKDPIILPELMTPESIKNGIEMIAEDGNK